MSRLEHFIISAAVIVIALFYAGAMFNFFPFFSDNMVINAIGFCTLIICVVIAVFAYFILEEIKKNK